jgi:hypothetical protein
MEIRSKRQFFAMWEAGVLGNRTRLWRDPEEAFRWGANQDISKSIKATRKGSASFPGTEIGFRELRKPGTSGAGAWEKVPWPLVPETAKRWRKAGREFIMDDGCPDQYRTLQGEVVRTERGLEGFLETEGKLPMRPAMAAGHMKHRSYLETRLLLERYMDPSSRDDLDSILEMFPDHAVEFSCFSVNVGIFPHRNTIFWEVRRY